MIRARLKTILLGQRIYEKLKTGRTVADLALGMNVSRGTIYYALRAAYPNGEWLEITQPMVTDILLL